MLGDDEDKHEEDEHDEEEHDEDEHGHQDAGGSQQTDDDESTKDFLGSEPEAGGTEDFLERVSRGDDSAIEQLYERYMERVLLLVRSVMGPRLMRHLDPEDLRTQVLERVRPYLPYVNDAQHFRRLLCQHARWVAASEARKLEARLGNQHVSLQEEGAPQPVDDGTSPSRRLGRDELRRQMADCMHALKDSHRLVLQLRFFDGLSIGEAACELGRTPDATSMLLLRAQKSLRECLLRHGVDPHGA